MARKAPGAAAEAEVNGSRVLRQIFAPAEQRSASSRRFVKMNELFGRKLEGVVIQAGEFPGIHPERNEASDKPSSPRR